MKNNITDLLADCINFICFDPLENQNDEYAFVSEKINDYRFEFNVRYNVDYFGVGDIWVDELYITNETTGESPELEEYEEEELKELIQMHLCHER